MKLQLHTREKLFTLNVVTNGTGCQGRLWDLLSLERFKTRVDMVLSKLICLLIHFCLKQEAGLDRL